MKRHAIDIIREIADEVEDRNLPIEIMVRDIQMMQFKIRSLLGDISMLQTMHYEFVRALWKIGRIDEIISTSLSDLDEDDQEALMDYFRDVEHEAQMHIKDALSLKDLDDERESILKLEIFKDIPHRQLVN